MKPHKISFRCSNDVFNKIEQLEANTQLTKSDIISNLIIEKFEYFDKKYTVLAKFKQEFHVLFPLLKSLITANSSINQIAKIMNTNAKLGNKDEIQLFQLLHSVQIDLSKNQREIIDLLKNIMEVEI